MLLPNPYGDLKMVYSERDATQKDTSSSAVTSSLNDLIARLEKLTCGDREVGYEVLLACGWRRTIIGNFYGPLYHWSSPDGSLSYSEDGMPCPTRSIDAAMTLVPGGWFTTVEQRLNEWWVSLNDPDRLKIVRAAGKTEAIARSVAALKARSLPAI